MKEKQKFTSKKLAWAKVRHSNLKKIDANYELSKRFTFATGESKVVTLQSLEERCNALWDELETTKLKMKEAEADINGHFVEALQCVSSTFGADSTQYELAGGVPKSKRQSPMKARLTNKLAKLKKE